jgi:hypothetical protein
VALVEGQIEEALRRPPFAPVRLVEAMEKKPAAPSVKHRPKLSAKHRRRLS